MIVNFGSIIPQYSFVREIWNWSGRSNNERCHSRRRIGRGDPYCVYISVVFWEIVSPSGCLDIFDRNLIAFKSGILNHEIKLSTWLPQGILDFWYGFAYVFDLQILRNVFTQILHRWRFQK